MDVESTLFPRVELTKVGIAPATSMFYFDANGRENVDDYRPQVHDSDGLLMATGSGETIWRPLANPRDLQISAFVDTGPRGFGLMQRSRDPRDFQDLVARYETRPSLWVEPVGDWGDGHVTLIEIPSDSEIHDNIVAYWAPRDPMVAGSQYAFSYRLYWGDGPEEAGVARVAATRRGRAMLKGDSPYRRFVVDFAPPANATAAIDPTAEVTASGGTISEVQVLDNPLIGGWRLWFKLDPGNEKLIEIRAVLKRDDGGPVETWLYRWTA
jgi:glucans biosynthesis protein